MKASDGPGFPCTKGMVPISGQKGIVGTGALISTISSSSDYEGLPAPDAGAP